MSLVLENQSLTSRVGIRHLKHSFLHAAVQFKYLLQKFLNMLKFWGSKIINFPFGTNGKLNILGVPILMYIVVITLM